MDEPTAALGVVQTRKCSTSSGGCASTGLAVVLISHNMPEVFEVADRIEVLRLGARVARFQAAATSRWRTSSAAMTGALRRRGGGDERRHRRDRGRRARGRRRAPERPARSGSAWSPGRARGSCLILARPDPRRSRVLELRAVRRRSPTPATSPPTPPCCSSSRPGMTYVIITAGIDLSVGAVLVFSGVSPPRRCTRVGGDNWGVIFGRPRRRARRRPGVGAVQRLPGRQGADPAVDRHARHARAWRSAPRSLITGGVDEREVPFKLDHDDRHRAALRPGALPRAHRLRGRARLRRSSSPQTRFGRYTYAVGSNEEAARRAGVNVDRHLIKVYALAGTLAGLAGFLSLARFSTTTIGGHDTDNLQAIAAVVIGGTSLFGGIGTMLGTVFGVFIPAVLQNGFVIVGVQPVLAAGRGRRGAHRRRLPRPIAPAVPVPAVTVTSHEEEVSHHGIRKRWSGAAVLAILALRRRGLRRRRRRQQRSAARARARRAARSTT